MHESSNYWRKNIPVLAKSHRVTFQCYHGTSQVTEELVQIILHLGLGPGAVDVFLEFICYSDGLLPEELLLQVKCPVLIAWGDKDPWESIKLGRVYRDFDAVEDFVVLLILATALKFALS
ncbi:hypothetical protein ES288_D13G261700v1 [Gossypium darwinii]|uniref:AB hydrolase-1 domain-containing protein n=1 Tax=Gossypium darwinii TaxID=34276 RepID=A0A5D2A5D8_GOSDA|nr:hypothetical protein ES288_D13G261700v1 [Gossypium darwinii]